MWEKISGLISIVVIVYVCIWPASASRNKPVPRCMCVDACLSVHERVIVTAFYAICGEATSSASVRKKHV